MIQLSELKSYEHLDYIDFEHLYDSMCKCKNNVLWKESVSRFYLNGIEETLKLKKQLNNGTYIAKEPYKFTIYSPKKRDILSISFRDRVYQRSLNDNVLYPEMTRHFIYDNWACQKGKGIDKARDRLKEFLHKSYRNYGTSYILQIDIKGYYPSMSHEIANELFKKYLSYEDYQRVTNILNNQYVDKKGYNPGSQMVQILGISYLNGLDHFIKEKLHIKYYLRYMDDLLIIHNDKAYLEKCLNEIEYELSLLGLSLNKKKTEIRSIFEEFEFLGFRFRLLKSGKLLMLAKPKNIKNYRRKIKKLVNKSKDGLISKDYVDDCFRCFLSNLEKGNTYYLRKRLIKYYESLWE